MISFRTFSISMELIVILMNLLTVMNFEIRSVALCTNKMDADKTELILHLIQKERRVFVTWPPQFGKNLFSSTIHNILGGRRNLFEGTRVNTSASAWRVYPVLYFDFLKLATGTKTAQDFEKKMDDCVQEQAQLYNMPEGAKNYTFSERLSNLVVTMHESNRTGVVILIDEYDFPLLRFHKKRAERNRQILDDFFDVIKIAGKLIRFLLVTGVSRVNLKLKDVCNLASEPKYRSLF